MSYRKVRVEVNQRFLEDLQRVWDVHGLKALEAMAAKAPGRFVSLVANLLPKEAMLPVGDGEGEGDGNLGRAWLDALAKKEVEKVAEEGSSRGGEVVEMPRKEGTK